MVTPRRNLALHIGVALVIVAVMLSGRLLEATVFPSGTIVGTNRKAGALLTVQAVFAAVGLYLIARRPRVTAVHVTAFVLLGSTTAAAAAALLQLAYVPPRLVSGWKAFAAPAERNQLGFRGQRIDYATGDYVVVLLGDSQVEAMGLPFQAMPERALEAHLQIPNRRTRVFSIGAGAYGTDQEYLAIEQYLARYRADLVVLWQTPANDIWNNVFNTHMASRNPKPTFWLDEARHLQGPSERLGEPLAASGVVAISLFERTVGLPFRERSWERRLPEPYQPLEGYKGPVRLEWQQRWDTNLGRMRDEELDTEKSHMAVRLTPRSPRMQYGLDLTRSLMHRIKAAVERQNGTLVVMQAVPPRNPDEPDEAVYVLQGKYFRTSTAQERSNGEYVNNGFLTELVPVTVPDWRISRDDAHLNRDATAQVMADLADRLRVHLEGSRKPALAVRIDG
jgi:hypothetical protein